MSPQSGLSTLDGVVVGAVVEAGGMVRGVPLVLGTWLEEHR